MWDRLFGSANILQKGLEASWTRNAVIRNNIANVETPNFKSSNVEFESIMASALEGTGIQGKRTNEKHFEIGRLDISDVGAVVVENDDTSMRMDGNNVDLEDENAKLAKNTILYNTIMTKLNSELSRIKLAISGGT